MTLDEYQEKTSDTQLEIKGLKKQLREYTRQYVDSLKIELAKLLTFFNFTIENKEFEKDTLVVYSVFCFLQ